MRTKPSEEEKQGATKLKTLRFIRMLQTVDDNFDLFSGSEEGIVCQVWERETAKQGARTLRAVT